MSPDPHLTPKPVRVRIQTETSDGGAYEVLIEPGLIARAGGLIPAVSPAHRYALISDADVAPLYGSRVAASLSAAGRDAELFTFAAGESNKTRDSWAALTDELLRREYGRDTCIVVVGGGVAGDLGGFVAATFMRGVPWINMPTTLLAMLDAAVGGKTGVDTRAGKNLVGAFHQPALVLADPEVLATLPDPTYRASMAEAIKHGAIADAQYFEWIEANAEPILARDAAVLTELVGRSVQIKAAVVAADTLEGGRRAILNFGHTIGHALERATDFGLAHGEAVAIGMVVEARIGELTGVTEAGTSARISRSLARFGLHGDLSRVGIGADDILEATRSDKKARGSTVRYALVSRVGSAHQSDGGAWTEEVPDELIRTATSAGPGALSQAGTEF